MLTTLHNYTVSSATFQLMALALQQIHYNYHKLTTLFFFYVNMWT